MELAQIEITEVRRTVAEAAQTDVRDLDDLQLVLVGGGMGETINA